MLWVLPEATYSVKIMFKEHTFGVIEIAAKLLGRHYRVFLEYEIDRHCNVTERPRFYRADVFAIKEDRVIIVEVGYCTKAKLQELKVLVPNAEVVHLYRPTPFNEWYSKRKVALWTELEDYQLMSLYNLHLLTVEQIAQIFPDKNIGAIRSRIETLIKRKAVIRTKHKPVNRSYRAHSQWLPEEDSLLIKLRNEGLYASRIAQIITNHPRADIRQRIKHLRVQNLLCPFVHSASSRSK